MRRRIRALVSLAGILALTGVLAADPPQDKPSVTADAEGLVKVKVAGLQQVYARADVDLSTYRNVMLDPIEVSFSKGWHPEPGGWPISAEEKRQIREGLARVLREEFTRELARSDRYRVVDAPADDVLRIRAEIRDLYINAPDVLRPQITRTYTLSAGEMTLVAELRDAPTGQLLARVIDRKRDPESPWLELTTRVDNIAAARRAAADWAAVLRAQLDAAYQTASMRGAAEP